jgi:hypothetical protein
MNDPHSDATRGDKRILRYLEDGEPRSQVIDAQQGEQIGLGSYGLDLFTFHLDDFEDEDEAPADPPVGEPPPLRPLRARDRWRAKRKLDAGE